MNDIQSESLIYESESIAIRTGTFEVQESEHSKVMSTGRRPQECYVRKEQEQEQEQEQELYFRAHSAPKY